MGVLEGSYSVWHISLNVNSTFFSYKRGVSILCQLANTSLLAVLIKAALLLEN